MRFLLVTGLSGAGKTSVNRYLEDMGAFCVDNLPPNMMFKMMEAFEQSTINCPLVAMAVDVRSAVFFDAKAVSDLISETRGTFDGGAAQTGDGYGDEETRLLGYLYTLNFKDPSYAPNTEFWEKAENGHWIVAWRTETKLHFADKPAGIQAIAPVEQDLTSAVAWNVTATWKSKKKPVVVDLEPLADFFEGCWAEAGE